MPVAGCGQLSFALSRATEFFAEKAEVVGADMKVHDELSGEQREQYIKRHDEYGERVKLQSDAPNKTRPQAGKAHMVGISPPPLLAGFATPPAEEGDEFSVPPAEPAPARAPGVEVTEEGGGEMEGRESSAAEKPGGKGSDTEDESDKETGERKEEAEQEAASAGSVPAREGTPDAAAVADFTGDGGGDSPTVCPSVRLPTAALRPASCCVDHAARPLVRVLPPWTRSPLAAASFHAPQ